ncbi:hypothetical protein Golob_006879 [Gossypium lobatum]|uniref:Uncharacterized protein n=1 Tax=Gossypium lobatum TaxID=34289 RepID=A0A7J8NEX4_9ROSI|nr:hypothetical protein [Gossypium lobatum]
MKDCLKARAMLEFSGLNNKFLGGDYSRCIDWIEDIAHELDNKGKKVFYDLVAKDADGFVHGGRMGFVDKELPIE